MPKIDVSDEAIIDAQPTVVYKAFLDVYAGVTNWWTPTLESKIRGNKPVCEGAVCDVVARSHGGSSKFSVKIVKAEEPKSIEFELSGDLVGTEKYTFEPADGKTKVQLQFTGETNGRLLSVLSHFVDVGKVHSQTIQKGFKACNEYLCKK
jgi:uncharacterized protein YndB with AHSA1/START domain